MDANIPFVEYLDGRPSTSFNNEHAQDNIVVFLVVSLFQCSGPRFIDGPYHQDLTMCNPLACQNRNCHLACGDMVLGISFCSYTR